VIVGSYGGKQSNVFLVAVAAIKKGQVAKRQNERTPQSKVVAAN
jgi:hypothetical protein